jgi:hypothetical protein
VSLWLCFEVVIGERERKRGHEGVRESRKWCGCLFGVTVPFKRVLFVLLFLLLLMIPVYIWRRQIGESSFDVFLQ